MRRLWDLGRGAIYALILDLAWVGLLVLFSSSAIAPWVLILVWSMVALVITGISIAEERYLVAGGFWLLQGAAFTLFLLAYFQGLILLQGGGPRIGQ